jgi:hypothetical protein
MILRKTNKEDKDKYVSEKIKKDLILTFERKGIAISNIDIDTKSGNLSVSVSIKEK